MKLALVGGKTIKKYSIADYVWDEISHISNTKINFEILSLESFSALCQFYWHFLEDREFIGFNIALPWKNAISVLADRNNFISEKCMYVNTVFKKADGLVYTVNTDVIGVEKSLNKRVNLKQKNVLIMGGGGAGLSVGVYLLEKYDCNIYIFDVRTIGKEKGILILNNYETLISHRYDVIINASIVGKYYLDEPPQLFSSPLDTEMFDKIIKPETIVMEMNYFPLMSQLLKTAKVYNLEVVTGTEMLVYQALASFNYYTGIELTINDMTNLMDNVNKYSILKENELYKRSIINP